MALTVLRVAGVVAVAYLLGGIPFGVVIGRRFFGVDVSLQGSGNTGATNVFRVLGWKAAVPSAILDIAKGAVAALLAIWLADPRWGVEWRDWFAIAAGMAAVLGHMYSPYRGLRGGKGVATAAGVIIVLQPWAIVILLAIFIGLIAVFRIVSVASVLSAIAYPVLVWLLYSGRPAFVIFAIAAAVSVIWAHRANLRRIFHGEEPRIDRKLTDYAKGPQA
jgi:acyl phosphate:glycerol-3-phosphate acyltransferase